MYEKRDLVVIGVRNNFKLRYRHRCMYGCTVSSSLPIFPYLVVNQFIADHFRITGSGTEYRIDKKIVTPAEYNKKLESVGIFTKAKNFLVFQVNKF